jgi:hypothetical protein
VAIERHIEPFVQRQRARPEVGLSAPRRAAVGTIETLEKLHLADAKERSVLSKHLEKNPWLIEPTWMLNKPEARVSTWIEEEFGLNGRVKGKRKAKKASAGRKAGKGDRDRVDFFCVAVGGSLHIV